MKRNKQKKGWHPFFFSIRKLLLTGPVLSLILAKTLAPLPAFAQDASKIKGTPDYEYYYDDFTEKGYQNVCKKSTAAPSIKYVDADGNTVKGKTVGDTVYVPKGTKVRLTWSLDGNSAFASSALNIWQYKADGFVYDGYNYAGESGGILHLRGKVGSSKVIGKILSSKTNGKWTADYSIANFEKIKFLCGSPQIDGNPGESPAVGNVIGNVGTYYFFDGSKPKIAVDDTPPSISASINGTSAQGTDGALWYRDNASITLTASDDQTGVASISARLQNAGSYTTYDTASKTLSLTTGGTNTVSYYATDHAGLSSSAASASCRIDTAAPACSIVNTSSGYVPKAALSLTVSDSESGVTGYAVTTSAAAPGSYTPISTKNQSLRHDVSQNGTYYVHVRDAVGHTAVSSPVTVSNIDTSAPTVSASISGDQKSCGWYKGSASVQFTAADTGGSGVKSITVNGHEADGATRTADVPEGASTYAYYATDNAGNRTAPLPPNVTVSMDRTAPDSLSLTPSTKDWTNQPIILTVQARDRMSGLASIELQYSADKVSWTTYDAGTKTDKTGTARPLNKILGWYRADNTYTPFATNQYTDVYTEKIPVKQNGYYRLVVTDRVGYVTTTPDGSILEINNYDVTPPSGHTIGIRRNTIQWVNAETGIEITAFGSDEESGLDEIFILEKEGEAFKTVFSNKFSGETDIQEISYTVHKNNFFRTETKDRAGNKQELLPNAILHVDNIDPVSPSLSMEPITSPDEWVSVDNGFRLLTTFQDQESGFHEAVLQKLTLGEDDAEVWEDTQIPYTLVSSDTAQDAEPELLLSKAPKHKIIVASTSDTPDAVEPDEEARLQGDTACRTMEFIIRENGTYRLKGTDLVENTSCTEDIIEITKLDGGSPVIRVEGNPDRWQNKDAAITVYAKDIESGIKSITLDGKDMTFEQTESNESFFTFPASKNQDFTVIATDLAGNQTKEIIKVTKIDKDPPFISGTLDIETGWIDGSRDMDIIVTDELSGIRKISLSKDSLDKTLASYNEQNTVHSYECYYSVTENGDHIITAGDIAGNQATLCVTETEAGRLKALEVMIPPDTTVYYNTFWQKAQFNKIGMVVDAIYNNNSRKPDIQDYIILNGKDLSLKQTQIDLSYTEESITVYSDTPIQVKFKWLPSPDNPYKPEIPELPVKPQNPDTPAKPETPGTPSAPDAPAEPKTPSGPYKPASPAAPDTPLIPSDDNSADATSDTSPTLSQNNRAETVTAENSGRPDNSFIGWLPALLAGSGLLIVLLLAFFFGNVTVYACDTEGEYKYLGRLWARKYKDTYVVKVSAYMQLKAQSGSYRFVFSKAFCSLHENCEILIKIGDCEYERLLLKAQDTIFVEHLK